MTSSIFQKFKKKVGSKKSLQNFSNTEQNLQHHSNGNVNVSNGCDHQDANSTTSLEQTYIDRVGNINFSTTPRIDGFSPTRRESFELRGSYTQPRPDRKSNSRDNPVFVDDPVDIYENRLHNEPQQHFSQGPHYDKRDRRSWFAPISNDEVAELSDLPRSKSLNEVSLFEYDYDRINLAQLKRRRQEKRFEIDLPESLHVKNLSNTFVDPRRTGNVSNFEIEHDGSVVSNFHEPSNGVYSQDDEPIEVLLARKLNEFQHDNSENVSHDNNISTEKLSTKDNTKEQLNSFSKQLSTRDNIRKPLHSFLNDIDNTPGYIHNFQQNGILGASPSFSSFLPSSSRHTGRENKHTDHSDIHAMPNILISEVNLGESYSINNTDKTIRSCFSSEENLLTNKESLLYWGSTESIGNENDLESFTQSQLEERKCLQESSDNVFTPDQTFSRSDFTEEKADLETVSWSSVRVFSDSETLTEDLSTELLTTDDTIRSVSDSDLRDLPTGKFFFSHSKASSLINISDTKSTRHHQNKASVVRLCTDDLFFKMEKTLSDLQTQLDHVLDTDPQDDFEAGHLNRSRLGFADANSSGGFKSISSMSRSYSLVTLPSSTNVLSSPSTTKHNRVDRFEAAKSLDLTLTTELHASTFFNETSLETQSPIIEPALSIQDMYSEAPDAILTHENELGVQLPQTEDANWFSVSNDVDVSINNPDSPSSLMVSIHEEADGDDKNAVSAYLNVDGPINIRTASGVTISRRESSVYRVPKKKKEYVDVLIEGENVRLIPVLPNNLAVFNDN